MQSCRPTPSPHNHLYRSLGTWKLRPSLHFLHTRFVAVVYPSYDDVPCSLFTEHVLRFGMFTDGTRRKDLQPRCLGPRQVSRPRRWWWWWALQGGATLISIRSMGSGPGESRVGRFAQHRISWWVRYGRTPPPPPPRRRHSRGGRECSTIRRESC